MDGALTIQSPQPLSSARVPASSTGFGNLAERLAEEMALCWRQGERPTAEGFLERYEELQKDPIAIVKLLCEEHCLRHEYGQQAEAEALLERFPQWRRQAEAELDRYRQLRKERLGPGFPAVGESWTDFRLLAELGRGACGRVFLAAEPRLADRLVVLKMSSDDGREHLTLARLQHTHIVPLNALQEDPARNLRAICMPYFGGASLAQLLEALKAKPRAQRSGRDLIDALDRIQAQAPVVLGSTGPARRLLARATYPQALCWIGACLAEALQYAHERELVHLDVKPANVLLAADGQPMLLDFHLAQKPVREGSTPPAWFGGTPRYMSPEQRLLASAAHARQGTAPTVDHRSDIYSLGLVLYEALAGELPQPLPTSLPPMQRLNPQVSVGLSDIVQKCLAHEPRQRYADAAALAADLRRHLSDLPLVGVKNRSLPERWRKWRRRSPHALPVAAMLLLVLLAGLGVGSYTFTQVSQRLHEAQVALAEGEELIRAQAYPEAVRSCTRGLTLTEGVPGNAEIRNQLADQLHRAHRGQAADRLHRLVDRLRFLYGDGVRNRSEMRNLEEHCQKVWKTRRLIGERAGAELGSAAEEQVRADLLDLVLLWSDLRTRLVGRDPSPEVGQNALRLLTEAEELLGPSVLLARERQLSVQRLASANPADTVAAAEITPRTAWEHFCLGRAFLGAGDLTQAERQFRQALQLDPQDFWSSFYRGQCAYRQQKYQEAVHAFSTCLALMPKSAQCFHNRALARAALGDPEAARLDCDQALRLEPTLAAAAFQRGILAYGQKQYAAAITDLQRALELGADAAAVHYNLALVHLAQEDRPAAVARLRQALQQGGTQPEAQELLQQLLRRQ